MSWNELSDKNNKWPEAFPWKSGGANLPSSEEKPRQQVDTDRDLPTLPLDKVESPVTQVKRKMPTAAPNRTPAASSAAAKGGERAPSPVQKVIVSPKPMVSVMGNVVMPESLRTLEESPTTEFDAGPTPHPSLVQQNKMGQSFRRSSDTEATEPPILMTSAKAAPSASAPPAAKAQTKDVTDPFSPTLDAANMKQIMKGAPSPLAGVGTPEALDLLRKSSMDLAPVLTPTPESLSLGKYPTATPSSVEKIIPSVVLNQMDVVTAETKKEQERRKQEPLLRIIFIAIWLMAILSAIGAVAYFLGQ